MNTMPFIYHIKHLFGIWLLAMFTNGSFMFRIALGAEAPTTPTLLSLHTSPLVLRHKNDERAILVATIKSGHLSNLVLRLTSEGSTQSIQTKVDRLTPGTNKVLIDVPVFPRPVRFSASLESPAGTNVSPPLQVDPPKRWTVYLTQHTHTDIGYTRPQSEILPEHLRYIDYALDYCDLTDGYPDDAKFRWTCETGWAVREYLERRPAAQIQRLKQRYHEGRIELTAMLLNMSEIASESALAASLDYIATLKRLFGPIRTAMQNDVNGAAWCLVDYLSGIGVEFFSIGINQTRSILPFDRPTPFWWESPSGRRLLAYRSDHYMTANFWHIEQGSLEKFVPRVEEYLTSLDARRYPFDRVGVQFSGYLTDNAPPSTVVCDLVKKWNEIYCSPRLRLSTAAEFLAWVKETHSHELPVYRVAWPDWWTDGFGSAARETAAARETDMSIQTSQALLAEASMLGQQIKNHTLARIADIQDNLIFYAEHTYGAAESVDDPLAANTQVQWAEKAAYLWEAVKEAALLREEAYGYIQDLLPRRNAPSIAVFNTLNWPRNNLLKVFIDHHILPPDLKFRMIDPELGTAIPVQPLGTRTEGTWWALWIKNAPPFGHKVLWIDVSNEKRPSEHDAPPSQTALENAWYSLTFDPARGAVVSLFDKELRCELVDTDSGWGLGQFVYEVLTSGRHIRPGAFLRSSVRNVRTETGVRGPIWQALRFVADMDGCATNGGLKGEIRLYNTDKRVEFHFTLRKLPVRSPESVYVVFPFNAPDSELYYEAQGGTVVPGRDQLPGSASDWQTMQSFVAIRNNKSQIVLGSNEVPLMQLGDFNLGKWQRVTRVEKPRVFSWVMNNYWFTNFRAEQEGDFIFSYYLTSGNDTTRSFATRFGWGSRVPLLGRVLPPGKTNANNLPDVFSVARLDLTNLLVIEARPARTNPGVIVLVRELDGKKCVLRPENVHVQVPLRCVDEVDALETLIRENLDLIEFEPYESKFLKLSL